MELFDAEVPEILSPRFNIAPTQPVLVLRVKGSAGTAGTREFTHMAWGLVPPWSPDVRMGAKMINARSETAAEKPSFRLPLRRRRCVVPASGYYEWSVSGKTKRPYFIYGAAETVLPLAGLWEVWNGPDGEQIETCAILTTESSGALRSLHHRVPCVLDWDNLQAWLDHSSDQSSQAVPLLKAPEDGRLAWHEVSSLVNSVRNDSPELIARLAKNESEADARPRDLFGQFIEE